MASLLNVGKPLRWIAACAVLVGGFEGLSTTSYHDKLANGLPTICYGETEGVRMGDHYTVKECQDLLARKLERYWHEIEPSIHVTTSDNEKIAYTSFAYNVGSGAFMRSSALKALNAGMHREACHDLLVYNRTRSVGYVKGLDIRRHKEDAVCLTIDREGPAMRVVPLNPSPYVATPVAPKSPPYLPPVCHGFWLWRVCK